MGPKGGGQVAFPRETLVANLTWEGTPASVGPHVGGQIAFLKEWLVADLTSGGTLTTGHFSSGGAGVPGGFTPFPFSFHHGGKQVGPVYLSLEIPVTCNVSDGGKARLCWRRASC